MGLRSITNKLNSAYQNVNKFTGIKSSLQREFFDEITREVEATITLERKTITLLPDVDPAEYVDKFHPRYRLVSAKDGRAIVEERPEYITSSYTHDKLGRRFTKKVYEQGVVLEEELLRLHHPDVFERVTFVPEPKRELVDLDKIDASDLSVLSKYIRPEKVIVKLLPPKSIEDDDS